jgi:3-oxoacyl-[acyl-carrier protein] reductase
MELNGKVALITGASRGIGAATAQLLARHGAAVGVNYYKSQNKAEAVATKIAEAGGKAVVLGADVRSEEQVKAMVGQCVNALGPIDILVLNAGMPVPKKPFVELTNEEFKTKVWGEIECYYYAAKAVIPGMIERRSGQIIGISSGVSRKAIIGFSTHTMVKAGIDALMRSLACELGPHGIRVNTVAPGLTETDATADVPKEYFAQVAAATPLRRVGQPEDVAKVVLGVLSGNFGFVTGSYISVSGGELMT